MKRPTASLVILISGLLGLFRFNDGAFWGPLLVVLGMPGTWAMLPEPFATWRLTFTLLGTGLLCTILGILNTLPFYFLPQGELIRPMMYSAQQFYLAGMSLLVALLLIGWKDQSPRWLGWLGVALCLLPWPVGKRIFRSAQEQVQFVLSD